MRIAFCFFGFLRHWQTTAPQWLSLIQRYNADVFIYTWDTEQYKDREIGDFPYGNNADPLDIVRVKTLYNPVEMITESYKDRHNEFLIKSKWIYDARDKLILEHPEYANLIENRVTSNFSMWYTWSKVIELKRKHEIDFTYDLVFLGRTDFRPSYTFDFNNVTKVITPPWPDNSPQPWVNYEEGICDIWLYGPSKAMDVVGNLYNEMAFMWEYLMTAYDFERIINPHKLPAFFMKVKNIEYTKDSSPHGSCL